MSHHDNPIIGIMLAVGTAVGVVSLQELDLRLAIVLKIVTIVVFAITGSYTLWKWKSLHNKHK